VLIKKTRIPVLHIVMIGFLPSFLKKFVYRLKGYKIASDVSLSLGCVIISKDVEIGKKSSIGFFTIIRARKIKIARFVKIGAMSAIDTESLFIDDDARINEQVYIGGTKTPQSSLTMGKRTIIMQASYINPTMPITIGDDSGIGGHCLLFTHGSWNSVLEGYPVKFAPINIGKKVWLPWRVFVMPGVSIGDGVVVGADSMINKDIPANCLVAGSPAKIIKENIPQPLSKEDKQEIINDIFKGFIQHLNHNDFITEQKIIEDGFEIDIKNKNTSASILFCETTRDILPAKTTNSILVLNKDNATITTNYGMIISLEHNNRIGTSDVGEELVQFLSRYGVRFDRLD
jgi:acetyltransferase-like isoleucine patch superfamily enzyme